MHTDICFCAHEEIYIPDKNADSDHSSAVVTNKKQSMLVAFTLSQTESEALLISGMFVFWLAGCDLNCMK